MPMSEKYLFVAAYLASVNRKESDDSVFSGRQRGKRKKAHAGHDEETEENASTMRVSASSSRSFTMDRLASIFAQIASTGGVEKLGGGAKAAIALGHKAALTDLGEFTVEQIASSYGDSDLFASVSRDTYDGKYCTELYCMVLYSIVLHYAVMYDTFVCCTVVCCTVL